MLLLVSGEGKNDIGRCNPNAVECTSSQFEAGSMTIIIDQLINVFQDYELSYIESNLIYFISEKELARLSKNLDLDPKRKLRFAGKKRKKETTYYRKNARALAKRAIELQEIEQDKVIAILFRDADGTQSSDRGEWQDKWDSMKKGFESENFEAGVPMLPKPKSEAWLLCALKAVPYQHCETLENKSGNDKSPNALKIQLAAQLESSNKSINDLLEDKTIDVNQIDMSSFTQFKNSLENAYNVVTKNV